ncbi:MAG: YdbH domain-containing protein, partial [Pseudomonadota bacterium]
EAPRPDEPFDLESLALPRLVLPGGFPMAEIETLTVNLVLSERTETLVFRDLRFVGDASEITLGTRLDDPPFIDTPLEALLSLDAQRLDLSLIRVDLQRPLLTFAQWIESDEGVGPTADGGGNPPGGNGTAPARAELAFDLPLDRLAMRELAPFLAGQALPAAEAATGSALGTLAFSGTDELKPTAGELRLEATQLTFDQGTIEADLQLQLEVDDGRWNLASRQLQARLTGDWPALRGVLATTLEATGLTLDLANTLDLSLRAVGAEAGGPVLTGSIGVQTPYPLSIEGALVMTADLGESLSLEAGMSELTLAVDEISAPGAIALDSEAELTFRTGRSSVLRLEELVIGASALELDLDGTLTLRPEQALDFDGMLKGLTASDFSFGHPAATVRLNTLTLDGELSVQDAGPAWDGNLGGAGLIVAPREAVSASQLMTADTVGFVGALAANQILSGNGRFDGARLPDFGVQLDSVQLTIPSLSLATLDGDLSALTTGLEATVGDSTYRNLDLDVRTTLTGGERLTGDGELLLGFSGALPFAFDARLDDPQGTVRLNQALLPASAFADTARVLDVTLPEALQFTAGELVLDGELSYDANGLAGAVDITGQTLAFNLGESRFEGLEFRTGVTVDELITGDGPLVLELAQLAAGLDVVSISTDIVFSGEDLGVVDLEAQMLGGSLSTPGLQIAGGQLQDSIVRWEGFDLGLLLIFLDVSGLDGSGTLDASIPIVNSPAGPGIEGGRFAARGPGTLRYNTGVPAGNIGLQALENFEYDSLEGTLDYAPEGDYTVHLDLLGKNPDLYGGHPVRFRLNLGGAMPALFRSLFVTGNFEEAILERLRAGDPAFQETLPGLEEPTPESPLSQP